MKNIHNLKNVTITSDLLESVNEQLDYIYNEQKPFKTTVFESESPIRTQVIRNKKLVVKWECSPGFKYDAKSHSCVRMTTQELRHRRKGSKIGHKKFALHDQSSNFGNKIDNKRSKSLGLRSAFGLD